MDQTPTLIADIEERIEALTEARQRTRKAIALARASTWIGAALLAFVLGGLILSNRLETGVASFSLWIGGIVFGGSSRATSQQLARQIAALEDERRAAIDALDMAFVGTSDTRLLH